jgi:hypothetical protein
MSELFQATICIFNRYTKIPTNWQGGIPPSNTVAWEKTKISNVMWKDNVHTNSNSDGKSFIDKTVSITIPLDEMETDKTFVKPENFVADTNVWTLKIGDIIVFGECDKEISASYTTDKLRSEFKTMEIQAISDSTDQDTLPLWKLDGV